MYVNLDGMSLLLTTPAILYAFNIRKITILHLAAGVSVGLIMIPLLTYYNTGWEQFGYRFSLDFMTPLLVLIALGAGGKVDWRLRLLILAGVLFNAWGLWFLFSL
jgi:hypothetical protein